MSSEIGDILVQAGKLQRTQLEQALRVKEDSQERLGALLVQLGFVAERDLASTLSETLGIPMASDQRFSVIAKELLSQTNQLSGHPTYKVNCSCPPDARKESRQITHAIPAILNEIAVARRDASFIFRIPADWAKSVVTH